MVYSKRIPPIKLKLSIDNFNKLVDMLNNMTEYTDENIANKSSKLKDKLLRYSVPLTSDDGENIIDIRCYQNEIVDLFYILFYGIGDGMTVETNYYEVLVKVRENIKQERMTNE